VKKRDLEKRLKDLGYWKLHGAKHDKWTNGTYTEMIPRHTEVNDFTAKNIIKRATENAKRTEG
jgi:hypothetical protein